MEPEVFCHAGFRGDERPVQFRWGGIDYGVEKVLDQYYGPDDLNFKVLASNGRTFLLRRSLGTPGGGWRLEVERGRR